MPWRERLSKGRDLCGSAVFRSVLPLGLANSDCAGACDKVKRAVCRRSEGETCCDG